MKRLLSLVCGLWCVSGYAATYTFTSDGPVHIPDMSPADPSFMIVEGISGRVIDITVHLKGVTHRYGRETMLALSNPDGFTTLLWAGAACKFEQSDLTLTDRVDTEIKTDCKSSTVFPSGGSYQPGYNNSKTHDFTIPIAPERPYYSTLNELIQDDLNGRWILWAEDFSNGDAGSLDKWELVLTTQDGPVIEGGEREVTPEG